MLWQPIRPFEFTSPVIDQIKWPILSIKPISSIIFAYSKLRQIFTQRHINERIVETPFILTHLPSPPAKILDMGACESSMALMLASMGYKTTAFDLHPYPFTHPNLDIQVGDITKVSDTNKFDCIICLSVLEHIGLAVYGGKRGVGMDQKAIDKMHEKLLPGGYLLLTTPLDKRFYKRPTYRTYDLSTLEKMLIKFKTIKIKVGFKNTRQQWCVADKLPSAFNSWGETPDAVALITAYK